MIIANARIWLIACSMTVLFAGRANSAAAPTVSNGKIPDAVVASCLKSTPMSEACNLLALANPGLFSGHTNAPTNQTPPAAGKPPPTIPTKAPAPAPPPVPPPAPAAFTPNCQGGLTNNLFVRSDPLDNFHYALVPNNTTTAADAKGASVSYTNNQLAGTQTAVVNGRASYAILSALCDNPSANPSNPYIGGYAVAPFVSSNGTWNEPPTKTSTSALRGGVDFLFKLETTKSLIPENFLYVSPFHQTDFRDLARIDGVNLAWEPRALEYALGASAVGNAYYAFLWQFRGEYEWINVSNPGLTNLTKGEHDWIGETTRVNFALFPLNAYKDWSPLIGGRFAVIGTAQFYYDARTGTEVQNYSAMLQYKLGECKKATDSTAAATAKTFCTIQGSSSISFEYDWGTDKDTLVKVKQYLVKLGYAF
jgi:hypothetical protein